jgi:glycerophosphoryl diester phosphodiesterase
MAYKARRRLVPASAVEVGLALIVAHRGYSAAFRENSVPAWRGAVAAGADVVEVDVRMTADGVFVCAHDPDLRLVRDPRLIAGLRHAEFAGLSAGGEPAAPLLSDAFAAIPTTTTILFDVKDERPHVLDALHAQRSRFAGHKVIFGLHALDSVRQVRALGDDDILGLLGGDAAEDEPFFALGGTVLRLWESVVDPARLEGLAGQRLWATTGGPGTGREVGDFTPESLCALRQAGISGFLVNDPKAARAALAG